LVEIAVAEWMLPPVGALTKAVLPTTLHRSRHCSHSRSFREVICRKSNSNRRCVSSMRKNLNIRIRRTQAKSSGANNTRDAINSRGARNIASNFTDGRVAFL
jgi:hypothetical protein